MRPKRAETSPPGNVVLSRRAFRFALESLTHAFAGLARGRGVAGVLFRKPLRFPSQVVDLGIAQEQRLAIGPVVPLLAVYCLLKLSLYRVDHRAVVVVAERLDDPPRHRFPGADGSYGTIDPVKCVRAVCHAPVSLQTLGRDARPDRTAVVLRLACPASSRLSRLPSSHGACGF